MIPKKDTLLAPYAENWVTRTTTGFATFGLTSAQATALAAVVTPYLDAWTALEAARSANIQSKDLTANRTTAKNAMLTVMRELYTFVQADLSVTNGNKELLGVTVKSGTHAPKGPPGAVSNFKVQLEGNGAPTLKWTSDNPPGTQGTMYQIWRKIGDGAFTYCAGTGAKTFTDNNVPVGTSSITYQIQAVRSTAGGPWAQFNVNFGTGGETSVTQSQPVKLAA